MLPLNAYQCIVIGAMNDENYFCGNFLRAAVFG